MANVKSHGNLSTEMRFIEILAKNQLKGWRRKYPLLGNPDFVFPVQRIAVFVDGCFWHGCPSHCRIPSTNTEYWVKKIAKNKLRDKETTAQLKLRNWIVIRFWEHELNVNRASVKLRKLILLVQ